MRALLLNPNLPRSILTLEDSCKISGNRTLCPPLGLLTVAALLPQEWEFRLVDLNARHLTEADWDWADLVLISGMIIQKAGVLSLVRQAKQRGKTSVVGGPYATSLGHEVLEAGADFLVRGEGEFAIPYFLAALEDNQPGGVFEEDRKPEITESPVPRFDLVNLDDYLIMGIQTSRGCPFNCEFCDVINLYGRVPRHKTPDQVIRELETLYRLGWRREVFISDDNFIGNKDHARAILNQLIPWSKDHGEPFTFWTQTSVNLGQDLPLIDLLTEANFSHVLLGVETPETDLLKQAAKYQNFQDPLAESLGNINARGLSMVASFIIGFDGEKTGTGDRICEFAEECGIPIILLNLLQPLPNTRLWDRLSQEGRLLQGQTSGDFNNLSFNYQPTRPREEIMADFVRVLDRLYDPSRYLARTYRYYLKMRPTRQALARQRGEKPAESRRPDNPEPARAPISKDILGLINLIWRQGIRPPYRWQFWRQLGGICRRNPSRYDSYLLACAFGENLFSIRRSILQQWADMKTS
jgi:radical SAM superfamily enzyme YgiQ (UPF0313 family)